MGSIRYYGACGAFVLVLSTCLLLLLAGSVSAEVEQIQIEIEEDTAYLPYSVSVVYQSPSAVKREPIRHTLRVVSETNPRDPSGSIIYAFNPETTEDVPAELNTRRYPGNGFLGERPVAPTLSDIAVFVNHDTIIAIATQFKKDTAWFLRWNSINNRVDILYAAHGIDKSKDGQWHGELVHKLTSDYDFDGQEEMFFYLNPVRDGGPRALFCVDPQNFTLEWQVPIASPIAALFDCQDSVHPGVILSTQAPGQGHTDTLFEDSYAYVARIDSRGQIIFAHAKTTFPFAVSMSRIENCDEYLLAYSTTRDWKFPPESAHAHVERIDGFGNVLYEFADGWRGNCEGWTIDYDGDGKEELFANNHVGQITVLSDALTPVKKIHVSIPCSFLAVIPRFDGIGAVLALGVGPNVVGLYDSQLDKLASLPHFDYVEIIERGNGGEVRALALSDAQGGSCIVTLTKRGYLDLAAIFYRRNQIYVLSFMFAALAGLMVSNFYRQRSKQNLTVISSQKQLLESAHKELAETHEALKKAQATIVAQEKYRQAKDIAGGFAHEIKNALFPADTAMIKLSELAESGTLQKETLEKYLRNINSAVARAVKITNLITQYTKLDSQFVPERVDLAGVVAEVIKANQPVLEQAEITCTVSGPDGVWVVGNCTQLGMVMANLLLNAIDALTNRANRTIMIQWDYSGDGVTLVVADNGAGIPEDILPRVFDTFFSTKPNRGTGLGLSISRKIIEMYGGSIRATSQTDVGTRFELQLRKHAE